MLSVLITTYRKGALLRNTLDAVIDQARPDDEVLVMDDGDGADAEVVAPYPVRCLTRPDEGYTLASATNDGVLAVQGEHVVKLDADCQPQPGCLDAFREAIEPGVLVCGRVTWEHENGFRHHDNRFHPQTLDLDHRMTRRNDHGEPHYCMMTWAGALGFTRSDYLRIGGMSTRYDGHYGKEESSLGHKAYYMGLTHKFVPEAHVIHKGDPNPKRHQPTPNVEKLEQELSELRQGIFPDPLGDPLCL